MRNWCLIGVREGGEGERVEEKIRKEKEEAKGRVSSLILFY